MTTDNPRSDRKPYCVVVDTSIWRSEPLLRGPLGETLIYTLSRQDGCLGLPEVVESEIKKQIVEAAREASSKAEHASRIISMISGRPPHSYIPTDEAVAAFVDQRINELSKIIVREPFALEHAKAALVMVNAQLPPNGSKNQQFKDSAIWQATLSLGKRYSACLITGDNGFFEERDRKNGTAKNLLADCKSAESDVKIYSDIKSCLNEIVADKPSIDKEYISTIIQPTVMEKIRSVATEHRFVLGEVISISIEAFWTQDPENVAIDYTLIVRIQDDPSLEGVYRRKDAKGVAHGSAYYVISSKKLEEHFVQSVVLRHEHGSVIHTYRDYDAAVPFPRPIDFTKLTQ